MPPPLPLPPGMPQLSPAPIRTPLEVQEERVRIQDKSPWGIWYDGLYSFLLALWRRPVLLSGLHADIPDATLYPENSRYWSTNTTTEYVNLYATPGDPSTAAWHAM